MGVVKYKQEPKERPLLTLTSVERRCGGKIYFYSEESVNQTMKFVLNVDLNPFPLVPSYTNLVVGWLGGYRGIIRQKIRNKEVLHIKYGTFRRV